ncbi:hypothetical protein Micbo1qcDRAFT_29214 [Microdochium bolleyi]|uniref:Uncharacterized protein n=1 Tax=Microdochium bolleyi TaxID=196109 RepID=A0A136JFB6_9PEZI|nr:hypothetical protein Micbo1qcDRAFT_29214 [Microdochium bolleyi]
MPAWRRPRDAAKQVKAALAQPALRMYTIHIKLHSSTALQWSRQSQRQSGATPTGLVPVVEVSHPASFPRSPRSTSNTSARLSPTLGALCEAVLQSGATSACRDAWARSRILDAQHGPSGVARINIWVLQVAVNSRGLPEGMEMYGEIEVLHTARPHKGTTKPSCTSRRHSFFEPPS